MMTTSQLQLVAFMLLVMSYSVASFSRKTACPHKEGFEWRSDIRWVGGIGSTTTSHSSLSAAEDACRNDASCTAFNNFGEVLRGNINSLSVNAFTGACVYLKLICPPMYGYDAKLNTEVSGAEAIAGAIVGPLLDVSQVQEACKINPKCTAWDSQGNVAIGGIDTYNYVLGTCAYVKNPCTPRAGFIAYSDLTYDAMTPPDSQFPALCGNDLYTKCLNDPTCQGFNTLRSIWTSVKPAPVVEYSGMCTYVRATGF